MDGARLRLRELVHHLRTELEWAARTGIDVTQSAPNPIPAPPVALETEPVLPVDAGRPDPLESVARAAAPAAEESPPPAFERDPEESVTEEVQPAVPPSSARRRPADEGRPWERYLPEDDNVQESGSAGTLPESLNVWKPKLPVLESQVTIETGESDEARLDRAKDLAEVRRVLGDCTRCKLHKAGRRQIVFGVGNPDAELMFIGEGPGRQEDQQGEPFVGEAGQLLTRIIEKGMRMRRSDVYIANIVKCRPPGNRDPEPDEVEACEPFLRAQIDRIKPTVIVALGKYAAQTLLRSSTPITRLRGRWHRYQGIDLMPTFHPAFVLRDPARKRPVWEDVQEVMKRLGREG